jgi:spore coat protein U-like protein
MTRLTLTWLRRVSRFTLAGCVWLGAANRAEAACTLSASSITFPLYNVFSTSTTDSTGTLTYTCANGDHDIRISISKGSSATFTPRGLKRGTETLSYNLFTSSTFGTIWGDGTGTTTTYFNHNPPNSAVALTVYARVPAAQDVSVGTYTDTVVVTIDY